MTPRQLVCLAIGSVAATLFVWSLRSNRNPTQGNTSRKSQIETLSANESANKAEVAASKESESKTDAPG